MANETLVISRPSTGISWISAAFFKRNLSIPTINFAVAPFVIFVQFVWFSVLKPKLHLKLDSNAHSINLIFDRQIQRFHQNNLVSIKSRNSTKSDFFPDCLKFVVNYCYANYWLIKSQIRNWFCVLKSMRVTDRSSWATANVVALSKKRKIVSLKYVLNK
jgi:hypothetical protein